MPKRSAHSPGNGEGLGRGQFATLRQRRIELLAEQAPLNTLYLSTPM